uniref:Putative secreted protein n=1 Tax=Anopheles marajoara TaxID=58244 RepID=A0A2M4CD55_9DIPT
MRGVRNAFVISVTLSPSRWAIFWATVLSGRVAWSELRSCLNFIDPNSSTALTMRKIELKSSGVIPMMFMLLTVA